MARLRREEEQRAYERMTKSEETYYERFPSSSANNAFSATATYQGAEEEDELTYEDVKRQVQVIFNVLISVLACAAAIWIVGRWWSTPARLGLSMSGGILVGIAEVVVYMGYIRRLGEAKRTEKKVKEVKEIIKTWVACEDDEPGTQPVAAVQSENTVMRERKRKKKTI